MTRRKTNPADDGPRQLDAYIRVSDTRGREGKSFISPGQQLERVGYWMKSQRQALATRPIEVARGFGLDKTEAVWPDFDFEKIWPEIGLNGTEAIWPELDVSGGTTDRPMLNEVMRRIEAGETDGVVVAYLSRFGRTLIGTLQLINRVAEAGGLFASVQEQFDISTSNGRLVLNMMLSIAQYELDRATENWDSAVADAIDRKLFLGAVAPFGYVRPVVGRKKDGRPEYGPLEPDPQAAPIVTELFERRAAGESLLSLQRWLEASVPGERRWTTTQIMRVLRRPTYLGRSHKGEHSNDEAHTPIVDRATWRAVQTARTPRGIGTARARSLLHGLVRCASCRYTMSVIWHSTSKSTYYRCDHPECPDPAQITVMGPGSLPNARRKNAPKVDRGLDAYVVERAFARYPSLVAAAHASNTELERLEEAVRTAKADLTGYAGDPDIQQAAGREGFLAGLARRRAIMDATEAELNELLRQEGLRQRPERDLQSYWPEMSMDERREALAQVVQVVFIRPFAPHPQPMSSLSPKQRLTAERGTGNGASPQRVHIVWVDEPLVDVPRQGKRGFVRRPFVFPHVDSPGNGRVVVGEPSAEPSAEVVDADVV